MAPTSEVDVLVVGAGPVGLALTAELQRYGVRYRTIDQAAGPSIHSKALGIHARTLETLTIMGCVDPFLKSGVPVRYAHIQTRDHALLDLDFAQLDCAYPYILIVPQSDTERYLTDVITARGGTIERPLALTGLTQDTEGVTATLRNTETGEEETVRARFVVGCDGAHSAVRHLLSLPFDGAPYPEQLFLADVRMESSLTEDSMHAFVGEEGLLAFFPFGDGRWRIVAEDLKANATGGASETATVPPLEKMQDLVRQRGVPDAVLHEPEWSSAFRVHRRIVSRLQEGRVFVAGDAAHIHSPAGGQGMNTGIQDVFNLAWKLALVTRGASDLSLLATYNEERLPVEQGVLRETDLLMKNATVTNSVLRFLRDHLLPRLTQLGVVQERLRESLSELAVSYSGKSLSEDHPYGLGPAAGERAPDVPLKEGTLYAPYLSGGKFQLLGFAGAAENHATTELHLLLDKVTLECLGHIEAHLLLESEGGAVRETYGLTGASGAGVYLIRPDGYVAFRSRLERAQQRLFPYLGRLFT